MTENLNTFLVDLASDRDRLNRFANNPEDTMSEAGLTAGEKTAVMSGDSRRLTAALGGSRSGLIDDVLGPPPTAPPPKKKRPRKPPRKKAPAKPARKKTPARPSRKRKGTSRPARKKR